MAISSAVGGTIGALPAGVVIPYAGTTTPAGWLLCFGQAVSRNDYKALFNVVGTTYGSGDGSTTFNVPDLRGRVIAGVDNMGGSSASRLTSTTITGGGDAVGEVGGAQTHTLTSGESGLPAHTHGITDPTHRHATDWANVYTTYGGQASANVGGTGAASSNTTYASTGITINNNTAANASSAHNNVQPTMVLNYIIKASSY